MTIGMESGRLSGWGRISGPGREVLSEDLEAATRGAVLSRGLGRSYGDSALPPASSPVVLTTRLGDRMIAFDRASGVLRAESGASLETLNRLFLPRGWFLPVTPGTQHVTLGGAVAADVHGKNHHRDGSFGDHVRSLRMRVADGRIVTASPDENEDLFWATIGGMGLTGHILEVELTMTQVPTPWIVQRTTRIADINHYVESLERAARESRYTVGWIDCLTRGAGVGRGVLIAGDWALPSECPPSPPRPSRRLSLPFEVPSWVLGRRAVRAFNATYFHASPRGTTRAVTAWEPFFYPLDRIGHWNRMYGARGFTQYQCVIPSSAGRGATREVLDVLGRRGGASFLAVIKDCGREGRGMLSFPREGISIALDLALRDDTQATVDALNERVLALGGRIYLAKDALTRREHFQAMEPRLPAFQEVRRRWDPGLRIRSAQSVRLFGDPS